MGGACSKGVLRRVSVSPAPEERLPAAAAPAGRPTPPGMPPGSSSRRRNSVSAEASTNSGGKRPARLTFEKPDVARAKIQHLVCNTLLFKELDDDQQSAIIDAMMERRVQAGEVIIREGEEADNFYVIETGTFEASKAPLVGSGPPTRVASYDGHGSFGELALMYNCPRAATITALSEGVLWYVQRSTFRTLVVHSMAERRQRYETRLQAMHVFRHLTPERLAAVADCLHQEVFEAGEYILWEGAPLDDSAKFYIIEEGTVDCFRTFAGHKRAVKTLNDGDVFGEVALLTKAPRQADCVASTRCKCLTMSRDAFERLMGPVEQSLAEQIAAYERANQERAAFRRSQEMRATDNSAAATGGNSVRASEAGTRSSVQGGFERAAGGSGSGSGSAELEQEQEGEREQEHIVWSTVPAELAEPPAAGEACGTPRAGTPTADSTALVAAAASGGPGGVGIGRGSAAALLPGSPRPSGRVSSEHSPTWRRSGAHRSNQCSVSSEAGEGHSAHSASGSPTAGSQAAHGLLGQALDSPLAAGIGVGEAVGGEADGVLPPIAEEPSDAVGTAAAAAAAVADFAAVAEAQEHAVPAVVGVPAVPAGRLAKTLSGSKPGAGSRAGGTSPVGGKKPAAAGGSGEKKAGK